LALFFFLFFLLCNRDVSFALYKEEKPPFFSHEYSLFQSPLPSLFFFDVGHQRLLFPFFSFPFKLFTRVRRLRGVNSVSLLLGGPDPPPKEEVPPPFGIWAKTFASFFRSSGSAAVFVSCGMILPLILPAGVMSFPLIFFFPLQA